MKLIILIVIILGLNSCSYYFHPPLVETRIEIQYSYKNRLNDYETSKWRKQRQKIGFEKYDKNRNIIEEGEYGEIWHFESVTKNADSTISIITGHGRNYKNLNTIHYFKYDSTYKKKSDELWQFKDNKKQYLIYKTIFIYSSSGQLIKEIEYDANDSVSRLKDYSKIKANYNVSKDSVFNFLYEGITRVEGRRRDTTITDSLGRPIEKKHFYKGKFSSRREYRYDKWDEIVTEIRYNDKPDSLWCITEWQYNNDKQLIRKFWKVVGSKTETKDIYIYNRKKLLKKILHYNGEELSRYTKYKYRLY